MSLFSTSPSPNKARVSPPAPKRQSGYVSHGSTPKLSRAPVGSGNKQNAVFVSAAQSTAAVVLRGDIDDFKASLIRVEHALNASTSPNVSKADVDAAMHNAKALKDAMANLERHKIKFDSSYKLFLSAR